MIGKTISHYRIIDKIGQGGMGVVYKAEDTRLHRTVALKFLPSHLTGDSREMTRFVREARAAAALSHPNICTIFEIDDSAEQPYIAMAYIEGRDLREITASGPLDLDDALRYATQIARGLEEAHAKGVVHRDIKGANIVVSEKGHAIVMDFGLAKLQGQTQLTQTGTTVGTVSYMSPEQARGDEVDHRTDIWSLGVVLYRMVAGRYPFDGEHPSAVLYAVMNERHRPLTALRTDVPLELERIVDKALGKDPGERYQSVSDMIVDLKALRNQLDGAKAHTTRPSTQALQRRGAPSRRLWLAAAAVIVVVVAGFFVLRQVADGGDAPVADRDRRVSIAVLPLDNLSGDDGQEYVADGMTEALIAELAQIRALRVISRTSVMRFKNTTQPIPEIADMLDVSKIIEGSVMQAGGRVRVTAQLIDAATDEHLWAQSYERELSDVLGLQRDVARAITKEVEVELTPGESRRLASADTIDPVAYDLYLRGRYHWNRRTPADLERALDLLQQAAGIEPDWPVVYSALAETYTVMVNYEVLPPEQAYPRARELAKKALALDPDFGAAWASLAGIAAEWDWDWKQAEEDFLKAIDMEPNNASAHQWYAEFLSSQGRFDEALRQVDLAMQSDPLSLIIPCVEAWIYFLMGDYERAMEPLDRVLELDPNFNAAYFYLADVCRYGGQPDRAAAAWARFYGFSVPGAEQSILNSYEDGGIDAAARTIINGIRQASEHQYVSPAIMGFFFASIGESDSAMVWLERAYDTHAYPLGFCAVAPYFENMRDDPRFIDLLQRMKLDHVTPAYARR